MGWLRSRPTCASTTSPPAKAARGRAPSRRLYLQAFFDARVFAPSAVDDQDLDLYAFELYRAFEQNAADNQDPLRRNGRLTIPTLAVWGAVSNSGPLLREMLAEVAGEVAGIEIARAGHWLPGENPTALAAALIANAT